MKRSVGVWLAIVLALGFGIYLLWGAYAYKQWWPILYSAPYLIGGIGLFLNKRWSQYFYYFLAVWGISGWIYGVWQAYDRGWPYADLQRSIISLVPGVVLITLYVGMVWVVYRHFRRVADA